MNRRSTSQELKYLLDHFELSHPGSGLSEYLEYGSLNSSDISSGKSGGFGSKIIIPPSDHPLDIDKVPMIEDLPVLFPCSEETRWYSVKEKQIHFHHDILKSAFYLLSGYQETQSQDRDERGRFPWKSSIQCRLGITQKPIVNYYFSVILEAFEKFCDINHLKFQRKKEAPPIFFLSHDVDRVVKYSLRDVGYWVLLLLGLKPSTVSWAQRWRNLLVYARGTFFFKKDPYWNFDEMLRLEESLGIRSTWFMLEKTRMENSRYHFSSKKIRTLIRLLEQEGHEVGIHGTLESSTDPYAMNTGLQKLRAVTKYPIRGNRQHYLKYNNPVTCRILEDAEITYDATLGFAEQIGFRNSFTFPFKLYDFDKQRSFNTWHFPLLVMDVSLTGYSSTPINEIPEIIEPLLDEVKKFRGVFSLLWHNCHLDEEELPGINEIYRQLLAKIVDSGFTSLSGWEVVERIRSSDV